MNPTPRVWIKIPDGGPQFPSSLRAMRTPDPPAPDTQRPVRITVKIARPTQFWITFWGILTSTLGLFLGPGEVGGLIEAGTVVFAGGFVAGYPGPGYPPAGFSVAAWPAVTGGDVAVARGSSL